MSGVEIQAADARVPRINNSAAVGNERKENIVVLAVTTSSVSTDMAVTAQMGTDADSYYWSFQADGGDVYIAFAEATGETVDETATTGNTRCAKINNGERVDWLLGKEKFIVVKGSVACNLRIHRSSGR